MESRYPDIICDLRFIVFVVLSMNSLPFLSSDKLSSTFSSNDAIVSCNSVHWHYLQVCHTEVSIHFLVLFHIFLFYFFYFVLVTFFHLMFSFCSPKMKVEVGGRNVSFNHQHVKGKEALYFYYEKI